MAAPIWADPKWPLPYGQFQDGGFHKGRTKMATPIWADPNWLSPYGLIQNGRLHSNGDVLSNVTFLAAGISLATGIPIQNGRLHMGWLKMLPRNRQIKNGRSHIGRSKMTASIWRYNALFFKSPLAQNHHLLDIIQNFGSGYRWVVGGGEHLGTWWLYSSSPSPFLSIFLYIFF